MNDVWYFDPITCAKAFNKQTDLTSLDAIQESYLAYIEGVSTHNELSETSTHVTFYNQVMNEKRKLVRRIGHSFNIIDNKGEELITRLDGNRTRWTKNGIEYLNIYPYTIEITYQPRLIEASVKLHKIKLSSSNLDVVKNDEDGIEYIA